jgi:hypothetical protein
MPRSLPADLIASFEDDVLYPFFAVELLFDEGTFTPVPVATSTPVERVVRLWTGIGTLTYEQKQYFGAGNLLDISSIEETSEIAAKGASITLTGIPSETVSLALSEPYQGRICNIYFGTFAAQGSGNVGSKILKEDTDFILLEDGSKITLDDRSTQLTQIFAGYMDTMSIEEGDKGLDFIEDMQDKQISWGSSTKAAPVQSTGGGGGGREPLDNGK